MQRGPLKVVICGRWKHCSEVIHRSGVCYCAVLSVVRKMIKAKVHISVEQRILIKFLTKEGCKPSEICSRLKMQYGERTLSNVSVYKWSSAFNPLNAELNPICHLLALLGAHHILHISNIRV